MSAKTRELPEALLLNLRQGSSSSALPQVIKYMTLTCGKVIVVVVVADMKFVQNFTQPDFQAKIFTPQKCLICDIYLAN